MKMIKIVWCLAIGLASLTAIQAQEYKSLKSIEESLPPEVRKSYFPEDSKILFFKELLLLQKTKKDFSSIESIKSFYQSVEQATTEINSKKLGNYKSLHTRLKSSLKGLKKQLGKKKTTPKKLSRYAKKVQKSLDKIAKSLSKNSGKKVDDQRLVFSEKELQKQAREAHAALLGETEYVSATKCQSCHPVHFQQWSMSQHAYAQLSPVYMAFQNAVNGLTSGTNGDFCIRCHNQVGMNKNEPTYMSNLDRHPASREGITCIVCHRVSSGQKNNKDALAKGSLNYGKISGRMALRKGDVKDIVFGPRPDEEVKKQIDVASGDIHEDSGKFFQLTTPGFCGTCHDVNLYNGFRLEEAFSEYKNSPAAKEGISCQDCHMGRVQGVALKDLDKKYGNNYHFDKVSNRSTRKRKMTDHTFSGPDHTVIHPALFPTDDKLVKKASLRDWLSFDYSAGWGSPRWEKETGREADGLLHKTFWPKGSQYHRWMYEKDRREARKMILLQFDRLAEARRKRLQVLRNGYQLVATDSATAQKLIKVTNNDANEMEFEIGLKNATNGHNTPTGFIAERLVWLEVEVRKDNKVVFRSGDLDPNGDLRDSHSLFVHNGDPRWKIADGVGAQRLIITPSFITPQDEKVPVKFDDQLVSLQSKFLTRNIRGGEREQVLAVNHSVDTLPFIRPSTRSTVLTGQPAGARIHRLSLPPGTTRKASYKINKAAMQGSGSYQVTIKLNAGMIPVNLVDAIKGVGFDYKMTPKQIARRVVFGFQPELNALRYYAIDNDKDLKTISNNQAYRQKALTELKAQLRVLSADKKEKIIEQACVHYYAEDVMRAKFDYIKELISQSPTSSSWLTEADFLRIARGVAEQPFVHLQDIKTFVEEKSIRLSDKKELALCDKIISLIIPTDLSDSGKGFRNHSAYLKSPISGLEPSQISSHINNGLLVQKVAGHETLFTATQTVEVK